MIRTLITAALLGAVTNTFAITLPSEKAGLAEPQPDATVRLEQLDRVALRLADDKGMLQGRPAHYGKPVMLTTRVRADSGGEWSETKDGRAIWRLQVTAPGASSLDLGFSEYWLPNGAELYLYDARKRLAHGPYTDRMNKPHGQFWTPVVPGDRAIIEVVVPKALADTVRLELNQVNYGFRFFAEDGFAKSGSCNVDVICPEGDGWRDQIRSVATYGLGSSSTFCTGQLVNNTARDNTPYFLTANHCEVGSNDAPSLTVYWNYESATCRTPGSNASGTRLNINDFTDTQSGASLVAETTSGGGVVGTDFSLLQLDELPPDSYDVFWTGWDRTGSAPGSATAIHHPQGHEKRISFTDQALTTTGYLSETGGGTTHWRVRAWSSGTTEPGSSGSALFDPAGRMIGHLSGGFASCSSNPSVCTGNTGACDWYGRFNESWEEGNSANRRLRDWLDPGNTGETAIDGKDACDQPVVSITSSQNPAAAGTMVTFTATATGGTAPYSFEWDLENDGGVDSTDSSVTAAFPDAIGVGIGLRVVDAVDCAATSTFGQVIRAPQIVVDSVAAPVEQCGDGDGDIEPGESWSFPVTLRNAGDAALSGGIAAFGATQSGGATKATGGPDEFGYTFLDSDEGICPFDFQDITGSGNSLTFDPFFSNFPALDDGVALIDLGGDFNLYGEDVDQIAMVTNGYLSSDPSEGGGDVTPDCPLPDVPDRGGGHRLYTLHDDLVIGAGFEQFFADCPRPGEAAGSAGCHIIQWNDVGFFDDNTANFDMQAVLYEGTNQIVYQYTTGNSRAGANQTVGLQNDAVTDALTYSCGATGSVPQPSAICIFHPSAAGPAKTGEGITLENPAVDIGDLAVGATTTVNVTVQIAEDFVCGNLFGLDYLGTAFDTGFSNSGEAEIATAFTAGCDSQAMCSTGKGLSQPRDGFWFNAARGGNGIDLHFLGDQMYSAWFTAEPGRDPVWYYVQTLSGQSLDGNQIRATILRFTNSGDPDNIVPNSTVVGEAVFSFLTDSVAVMNWTINGVSNGEKLVFFDIDTGDVDDGITDQWFNPSEAGWGLGVHRQGGQEFNAVYFYGTDGEPRWVVTVDNQLDDDSAAVSAFEAHCPGCAYIAPTAISGGIMTRQFGTDGTGTLDLNVDITSGPMIQWNRSGLPVQQINPPAKRDPQPDLE